MLASAVPRQEPSAEELAGWSEADRQRIKESWRRRSEFLKEGAGYSKLQSTRPQTLAYALTDSPVGQLAWIVDKFKEWTDSSERPEDAVDRDQLLTNVSLYWFTRSGASAARFIYEGAHSGPDWGAPPVAPPAPQGLALFGGDDLLRRVMDPEHRMAHWSEFERGGHFPAMEVPDLLVGDLREFFRGLR
jgi:pimeloyl-ACP methyl ester carboxylesterase